MRAFMCRLSHQHAALPPAYQTNIPISPKPACPFAPGASGNVATEDIVHMLHEMGIDTGVDLLKAMETARLAARIVGHDAASAVLKAGRVQDLVRDQPTP